ncbi:MAG: FAD-binding protein [Bacteroidetes bacterium]|nr:FAD-binding protein [Bacteroidota bacterium]
MNDIQEKLQQLRLNFQGDIYFDEATLLMYSTDASVYKEKPLAVSRPKGPDDIRLLISFAAEHQIPLIPRAAGTSLAGQVVGKGIVADVSKYMRKVLEINVEEHWVRVEPGVVPDELNKLLEPMGLFFGPETSTSNRCMIGGMVGNNSCGAHSVLYGSTRDHVLEVKGFLSDASEVHFRAVTDEEFGARCELPGLEGEIYRSTREILSDPVNQESIRREYPHPDIRRRNTGYSIDLLLESEVFGGGRGIGERGTGNGVEGTGNGDQGSGIGDRGGELQAQKSFFPVPHSPFPGSLQGNKFNFCKLIAGSEGTLMVMTEIKLNLVKVPPKEKALVCVHCKTLEDAFEGNLVALSFKPGSVELIDRIIIECTKDNIEQRKNRFFIEGEPEAILIVEFERETREEIVQLTTEMEKAMRAAGYGYHFPVITGPDMGKVWALRKAGLGLLSNVPGDAKPVTMIEDTAVRPEDLPAYMREFREILKKHGKDCVYYAHIATGELHLKPVLNLKEPGDLTLFRTIATEIALLVKKFRGSLSGEHGDGRLRGEFIPLMIGEHNYQLVQRIKKAWDPYGILNPGKITATPPMDRFLRYEQGQQVREISTYFSYSRTKGLLRAVEQCNGSGDCRKSEIIGGTMCPSYMASRDENTTTRARANVLREFLTHSPKTNPFDHKEIKEILDLCLSCKGCKSECPSNVDMAKYKAEFLQHYYDAHGVPFRSLMIANITRFNRLGSAVPGLFNFFISNTLLSGTFKKMAGFAPQRSIPKLAGFTLHHWFRQNREKLEKIPAVKGKVYFFADEFTEFNDVEIGIKAINLLTRLGYRVEIPDHLESGRTFISKGLLKKAKQIAEQNVRHLADIVTAETPLLGTEPSGILTFRDEYPELVSADLAGVSESLGRNCLLIEEFLVKEFEKGNISKDLFTAEPKKLRLHGHCQQKSLVSTLPTKKMLQIPENYTVDEIKSGCCGMAGSFGFEKEHYALSMKVGELVLFPEIRKTVEEITLVAPGTSCRHHILDGTGRKAVHPVEVMWEALIN